jgi:hypothetical protein
MADREATGGRLIAGGGFAGSYPAASAESRKLRLVSDWTVALLFRRDIVELGPLERPRSLDG